MCPNLTIPFALTSAMLTLAVPSLARLTMVSTLFMHREHRRRSTAMKACGCVPAIEYSDLGEGLSEIVHDVDEVVPEDEVSAFGCGRGLATRVWR